VIRGFTCAEIIRIFRRQRSRRLPSGVQQRAFETLNPIDAATRLDDLRLPPSNRLEALRGDRARQRSIRSNDLWRVGFRWDGADAHDVEIVDYHR
jgi:proteic killer suppression protein